MNIIQVGLGDFGFSWLQDVILKSDDVNITGMVDKNTELLKKAKDAANLDESILFTSLQDALKNSKPDFILNITPPGIHKTIDLEAFENGIPVLSEKPIAESYEDALEIMNASRKMNVPIMIAENYRYHEIVREVRNIIIPGKIGKLNTVYIDFFRNHHMTNYHKDLKYPLLLDVSIHHLDMLRYITGTEALEVYARQWNPEWTWYNGLPCMDLQMEMENNIRVSYRGSVASPYNKSKWLADWRIEGSEGVIEFSDGEIRILKAGSCDFIQVQEYADSRAKVLNEFIQSLKEKRTGETDISDNIKTYRLVHDIIESSEKNAIVKVADCGVDL